MQRTQKEIILTRIYSGIFIYRDSNNTLFIYPPDRLTKHLAYEYYIQVLDSIMFEDWLDAETIERLLISREVIPPDVDKQIADIQKEIDKAKMQAFENVLNPPQVQLHKKQIVILEKRLYALISAKHSLDHLTKEGYADLCRVNFLISHYIKDERGQVFDLEEDAVLSEKIFAALSKNFIPASEMREISRTDPWRSIWNASEVNIFGTSPVDWTEDQKTLILYSKMYDNCYKHPECPDDNIIEDDILLDGWMIYQRKKSLEERKNKNKEELGEGEHFILAKNEEHRREIDKLNDARGRSIRQQREQALAKHGKLKEALLPDVQQELRMQANQILRDRMKGN
jgi:uncharacterized protein YheU (UPF0270 family)